LSLAVIAIIIAVTEPGAEVIAILLRVDIIAVIAIGRVLVGIRGLIVVAPAILLIGLSGTETFVIARVDSLAE